jgi:hypothetical protein
MGLYYLKWAAKSTLRYRVDPLHLTFSDYKLPRISLVLLANLKLLNNISLLDLLTRRSKRINRISRLIRYLVESRYAYSVNN